MATLLEIMKEWYEVANLQDQIRGFFCEKMIILL